MTVRKQTQQMMSLAVTRWCVERAIMRTQEKAAACGRKIKEVTRVPL